MSETIKLTKGNLSPSLTDVIKVNNQAFDLSGSSVKFRMRPAKSSTLKVDSAATIVSPSEGTIRYDWAAADVDTAGEFFGWWRVTLPSTKSQDSVEFLIIVDDHTDGLGVSTGAIAERVRAFIPSTYKSLSDDVNFGDIRLQQSIDLVKYKLFATNVDPSIENTTYNPMIQDFIAKITTVKIIPSAVDYYKDQHQTYTTTGTNEVVSFPDRIRALWDLRDRLVAEIAEDKPDIEGMIDIVLRKKGGIPKVDTVDELLTSNPQDFGRAFRSLDSDWGTLPWTEWS